MLPFKFQTKHQRFQQVIGATLIFQKELDKLDCIF
jgi:hypothetical protein